jgi:hypothetical protein
VSEPKLYPRTSFMMLMPEVFWFSLYGIVLGFWGCVVVKTQLPESMTNGSRE